jgi:hypothetical protein
MQNADLGIVVLDASGNILGGGATYGAGPISYGSREYFNAFGTFNPITYDRAKSVLVSPVPTYPTQP